MTADAATGMDRERLRQLELALEECTRLSLQNCDDEAEALQALETELQICLCRKCEDPDAETEDPDDICSLFQTT